MLERDVASNSQSDTRPQAGEAAGSPINELPPAPADASPAVPDEAVAAQPASPWLARYELARHRAETERLRLLVDFLARPIHAHGGADPDPDIVTAYNLAVEAALNGIRRAAQGK